MSHHTDDSAAAPRRPRRLPWLAAAAAACLGLAVAAGYAGREPRLMDRARKVYQWHELPWSSYSVWLTDDRFVSWDGGYGMWLYDVHSGACGPVPAEAALAAKGFAHNETAAPSPDGNRLLVHDYRTYRNAVISLDGKQFTQSPGRPPQDFGHWLADGSGWIEQTTTGTPFRSAIIVHSLSGGSALRVLPSPAGLDWQDVTAAPNLRAVVTQAWLMGDVQLVVSTWDLLAGKRTHRWTERPPGSANEAVVSPQGDRIAWLIWRKPSRWRVWLHDHVPRQRVRVNSTQALLVSRLDGSDMRTIGAYDPPAHAKEADNSDMVDAVQWLPSGKALSFTDGTALYTVPAD